MKENTIKPERSHDMKMTEKEYMEFMYNRDNAHKCDKCPEKGPWGNGTNNPCGQPQCWVTVHCNRFNK